jgi:hypothetical protein
MNKKIYSHIFNKIVHQIMDLALKSFFILIIPYVIWPIIIYLEKALFNYIHGKENGVLFTLLIYQILIGNGMYLYFWFMFNLIFISLLFIIIIFVTQKYLTLLILFGLLVFFISSSNIYTQFWKGYNKIVVFPIRPIAMAYIHGLAFRYLIIIKEFFL